MSARDGVTRRSADRGIYRKAGFVHVGTHRPPRPVESRATSIGPRCWILLVVWGVVVFLAGFVVFSGRAHAEGAYTADDTRAAIHEASVEIGVSEIWLVRVVDCETGGTFDPYAVGKRGELGAAQLAPWGELRRFLDWQYTDPFSPYQAIRFMAQEFAFGRSGAWSCS